MKPKAQAWLEWIALAELCLLAGVLAFRAAHNALPLLPDEFWHVNSAMERLAGRPYPVNLYPTFPGIFYEAGFRAIRLFMDINALQPLALARMINSGLYLLNIILFHAAAAPYLDRVWRIPATLLFAFSPIVFFSGVYVKTEPLLIAELLAAVLCVQQLWENPFRPVWHILAAIPCGLAIATKFNPTLILIYVMGVMFAPEKGVLKDAWRRRTQALWRRQTFLFILVLAGAALAAWPTLWRWDEFPSEFFFQEAYFAPYPSMGRAVDEWLAFPFGRYSHTLLLTLPMAAGLATFLAAAAGLVFRAVPKQALLLFGVQAGVNLLITVHATLWRSFFIVTLAAPFLALCAGLLLQQSAKRNRWLGGVLVLAVLATAFYGRPCLTRLADGVVNTLAQAQTVLQQRGVDDADVQRLTHSSITLRSGCGAADPESCILGRRPAYIVLSSSYMANFCKYRRHEGYRRQCAFFNGLLNGGEGYRAVWSQGVRAPMLKPFQWDPELDYRLYILEREGAEGEPAEAPG